MRLWICLVAMGWLAQAQGQGLLDEILAGGSDAFQQVLKDPRCEVQIVYGQVSDIGITHHSYGVDTSRYFYPASTVKMLAAIAAVKRLSEMKWPLATQLKFDSTEFHPRYLEHDELFDGPITIEHLIQKIFTYSDNQAYNILYGWLGREYIAGVFEEVGLPVRLAHQLGESAFAFPPQANAHTQSVQLYNPNTGAVVELPAVRQKLLWSGSVDEQVKGKGYWRRGELMEEPFDFSAKNFVPLSSLLGALERIEHAHFFTRSEQFGIEERHRNELKSIMGLYPKDMPAPIDTLPDNYVKFFFFGDQERVVMPEFLQIHNKVGWAYGYLTDVAYIQDEKHGVSFYLAATVHVNENEIYNDGIYQYAEKGLPFLAELGRLIHAYEIANQ